jgi:Na+-transporting NADH:ubiquinone oxidoreductase subunit NqrD
MNKLRGFNRVLGLLLLSLSAIGVIGFLVWAVVINGTPGDDTIDCSDKNPQKFAL